MHEQLTSFISSFVGDGGRAEDVSFRLDLDRMLNDDVIIIRSITMVTLENRTF